ncbi:MAG: FecR family protein [Candidatus Pedobacter colombiensis]|uniref:FecR family protein n=1 Tax=Candidatus Pedobacter colombiensis TaxID=3121371 RepID=A0AAJ5W5I1_9SPHI|nr:FecR family protein [Pedobacter sp.]WEK17651.1 MAG: FecR family protein [Pedobacter sp.]
MTDDPGKLLDKYNAGLCTEEERIAVESWYLKLSDTEAKNLDIASAARTKAAVWSSLTANQPAIKLNRFKYWAAAAILLIIGSIGYFYSKSSKVESIAVVSPKKHDIAPGGNKAFLTLADGQKISLTDANSGEIVKQGGLSISKTADGKVVYTVDDQHKNDNEGKTIFNTIETPNGGQYQINLPDGTKVWLNSASSLRYPTKFAGNMRRVELTGEGYFEVAKVHVPFVVKTIGQEVQVLGTHFNINSYKDEGDIKTTLLEGSVRVTQFGAHKNNQSKLLKPGEQSQLTENTINVKAVDTESIVAWKNGDFIFKGDDLKSIMNKVARWYDVEVVYKGDFDHLKFGGYISRSKNISAVLNIMESTGKVDFDIKGKLVTVSRVHK